ncbi:DUF924 family protein [Spirochaetota bacterium]
MTYDDILSFWFEELESKKWFKVDENLDKKIRDRFLNIHSSAVSGELFSWRETITGRLAEIIIVDQFSRNMFRGSPGAFAHDSIALVLSQEAVRTGLNMDLEPSKRAFLYLPFMHSESKSIHVEAVNLFSQEGLEFHLKYEMKHKEIIDRFGRYPHRNEILGRKSTDEEVEFLKQPGSSF